MRTFSGAAATRKLFTAVSLLAVTVTVCAVPQLVSLKLTEVGEKVTSPEAASASVSQGRTALGVTVTVVPEAGAEVRTIL